MQGDKRIQFKDKDEQELRGLITRNYDRGIREIVFTGGECTIRQDLLGLIAFARCLGYQHIQIQTNGRRFFYLDFCKACILAGANEFALALHGPNAQVHDGLTQAKGSFDQTAQGIKNLKMLGQKILMNTVITNQNYKHLPELARLFVSLNVDQFQLAFIHILGSAGKNKELVVPRKSEIMPYVKKALDIGIDANINVMTEAIPYCFMQGYEQYVAEKIIPMTRVEDATWVVEDYTKYRLTEGKIKQQKCATCSYNAVCEGPWKEYPELYGWDEFAPRDD